MRCVLDGEDVNLVYAHEPIDDSVRAMNDLANLWIVEFRHSPTRLWKGGQSIGCRNDMGDNDRRVARGVLTDECANGSEIRASLIRPENSSHDKNCFLTSS